MIKDKLIKFIKDLDSIMDTWDFLTIRRSLLVLYTIFMMIENIITLIYWMCKIEISETWVNIMTIQYTLWGVMIGFYFYTRIKGGE